MQLNPKKRKCAAQGDMIFEAMREAAPESTAFQVLGKIPSEHDLLSRGGKASAVLGANSSDGEGDCNDQGESGDDDGDSENGDDDGDSADAPAGDDEGNNGPRSETSHVPGKTKSQSSASAQRPIPKRPLQLDGTTHPSAGNTPIKRRRASQAPPPFASTSRGSGVVGTKVSRGPINWEYDEEQDGLKASSQRKGQSTIGFGA